MGDYEGIVVGIDLGTTHSRVAVCQNKHVTIIPNENGNLHTPSCVAFTDNGILVGDAAKEHAAEDPTNTISMSKSTHRQLRKKEICDVKHDKNRSNKLSLWAISDTDIKRLIERSFSCTSNQNGLKVVGGDMDLRPKIIVNGNGKDEKLEPEEVASLLFGQLKEIGENHVGSKVLNAVVTVPANFNDSQRKAIKEAANMAGLSIVLLEEPIAAILAYGLEKDKGKLGKRNVLVFDFGGGSLDVSIVTIQGKELKVKATIGDTYLGGEYFDDRLAKYCQRELMLDANENPEALRRLRSVAEKAKLILSSADQSGTLHDEVSWEYSFTLVMLERMNRYQFEPCIELVAMCLMDAGMDKHQLDDVILVGGLSNIPRVQELLQSFFEGKELSKSIKLDEAIVRGAAIQAAMLSGDRLEKNREEKETTITFNSVERLNENSPTNYCALLDEHVDHENQQKDKTSCSKKNTGKYKSSNWIWTFSLAAVAAVSFFVAPRACDLLEKRCGRSKQWSTEREGDIKECSRFLETKVRPEKQLYKVMIK